MIYLIFGLTGAFTGIISGLLGVGGGLTIVPVLYYVFLNYYHVDNTIAMHIALATALVIAIPTLLSSVISHHRKNNIIWEIVVLMMPGLSMGALLSSLFLVNLIPVTIIKIIFALFCVSVAMKMLIKINHGFVRKLPSRTSLISVGIIIGTISSILGNVGGSLSASFLGRYEHSMKKIVASSAAMRLPISIFGSIGFLIAGISHGESHALKGCFGYIYLPAAFVISTCSVIMVPYGVLLTNRISNQLLKKIFAIMLLIAVIKMI